MSIVLKDNEIVFAKIRETAIIPSKKLEDAGYDLVQISQEVVILMNDGKKKALTKLKTTRGQIDGIIKMLEDIFYGKQKFNR